jgi:hypothetical protein
MDKVSKNQVGQAKARSRHEAVIGAIREKVV